MVRLTECDYNYIFTYRYVVIQQILPKMNRISHRKCNNHFMVKDGVLYYSSVAIEKHAHAENHERIWRTVVRTEGERKRIMEACHSSSQGNILFNMYNFTCSYLSC